MVVPLVLGFLELSSPCGAGRLGRGFVGGVKDGGVVRIGAVPLGFVDLTGGVVMGFDPKILESIGREGAGLGNLENFSASRAIWYACSRVLTSLMKSSLLM